MSQAKTALACWLSAVGWLWSAGEAAAADPMREQPRLRRPTAVVVSPDGRWAYTANRRSGTISILSLGAARSPGEVEVAKQLADLDADRSGTRLVAVDDAEHALIVLSADGSEVRVRHRLLVPPYPVCVALSHDGATAYVASLWSRQLSRVEISDDDQTPPKVVETLDLPFAPREMLLIPERERLIVADGFDGRLAVISTPKMKLLVTHEIPAHNIRGLKLTADRQRLVMIHQMLNEKAQSIQSDVHWGLLMSNDLRWILLEKVLAASPDKSDEMALYRGGHMHPLGEPGRGGGDPTGVDVAPDGTVVVTLGGNGDIMFGKEDDFSMRRLRSSGPGSYEYSGDEYASEEYRGGYKSLVQRRPMDVKFTPDGRRAVMVDMFADGITVADLAGDKLRRISLGPTPRELSPADRGEMLFYNARMSHDGWMSCHSCHPDGHTNGQLNDNLSDGGFGTSKRVLSLLGVRDTAPYAWSGTVPDLKEQMRNSLVKTMQGRESPAESDVAALAAFTASLTLPPPVEELRGQRLSAEAAARGRAVFEKRDCGRCHQGTTFTSPASYDVGVVDELGNRKFNPPSLRGLSHRGPKFFHDNRAASLEEVFEKYAHPDGQSITAEELADLVGYLKTL